MVDHCTWYLGMLLQLYVQRAAQAKMPPRMPNRVCTIAAILRLWSRSRHCAWARRTGARNLTGMNRDKRRILDQLVALFLRPIPALLLVGRRRH